MAVTCGRVAGTAIIDDPNFRIDGAIELSADEVHLWRIDLAAIAQGSERWREVLSTDECARADRFRAARDREFFTATRAVLRMIAGNYVGMPPATLEFFYSEKEKPHVDADATGGLEFNVSHSGSIAVLAFARARAVGVDVELLRDNFDHEGLARRFFSEREQQEISLLPAAEKYAAFFRCWTRKEAYIKAQGVGLSMPLRDFDVSLRSGEENALLDTRPDSSEAARWTLRDIAVPSGYVGALCVRGTRWTLRSQPRT